MVDVGWQFPLPTYELAYLWERVDTLRNPDYPPAAREAAALDTSTAIMVVALLQAAQIIARSVEMLQVSVTQLAEATAKGSEPTRF